MQLPAAATLDTRKMDSISKDFGYWVKKICIQGLTGDGKEEFYISEDDLRGYWNENLISDVLWQAGVHRQTLPPPRSIIKSYIRIFSILVYIATPNLPSLAYLSELNEKGSDDHILPFMEGCFPGTLEGKEVEARFLQSQFLFSPVVFGSGLHGRDLHSRCVLPLTFERQLSGHFGSPANTVTTKLYKLHKASKLQTKDVHSFFLDYLLLLFLSITRYTKSDILNFSRTSSSSKSIRKVKLGTASRTN